MENSRVVPLLPGFTYVFVIPNYGRPGMILERQLEQEKARQAAAAIFEDFADRAYGFTVRYIGYVTATVPNAEEGQEPEKIERFDVMFAVQDSDFEKVRIPGTISDAVPLDLALAVQEKENPIYPEWVHAYTRPEYPFTIADQFCIKMCNEERDGFGIITAALAAFERENKDN